MEVISFRERIRPRSIAASIELTAKQAIESPDLPVLLPRGTRVYIPDIGVNDEQMLLKSARRITDLGYIAVPHIAARRLTTRAELEVRIKAFVEEAGVVDVLVIGGDIRAESNEFRSSIDVLETGILDKYGITHIGIAGHPEGSRDFSDRVAIDALQLKQAWARRTGASIRIVTQFGFDARKFIAWAEVLGSHGIEIPVHLGVAGPAKITTLLKYATQCGVGNSLSFLKKRGASLADLLTSHSPEDFVRDIENQLQRNPDSAIEQLHIFPFGGTKNTVKWLEERGSWQIAVGAERRSATA